MTRVSRKQREWQECEGCTLSVSRPILAPEKQKRLSLPDKPRHHGSREEPAFRTAPRMDVFGKGDAATPELSPGRFTRVPLISRNVVARRAHR